MNSTNVCDWRFVLALSGSTVGIIFALKMDSTTVKEVSIKMVEAFRDYAIAKDC